jgi:UDP-N-acetyl-alpha-D-muramoyl-L-alanyl-L-glutamate epimerase
MAKLSLDELRRKHPKIIFSSLDSALDNGVFGVNLHYRLDPDIEFTTSWKFPGVDAKRFAGLDQKLIRAWLVRLGLVELFSYWKAACPPEIVIAAGYLAPEELPFWRKLLANGMSEFFYVNGIDGWRNDFVRFAVEVEPENHAIDAEPKPEHYLTPVGGGKDSAVTIELIKKTCLDQTLFMLNPGAAARRTADVSGVPHRIEIERVLDKQIIALNGAGYLNGHTPFSALLAFASTFAAYLHGFSHVALSNEWSANEGNIVFMGHAVNHQYSKSYEFEKDFREYLRSNLSEAIDYFSALRPLHELQIARIFGRYPAYFPAFVSCNHKIKTGEWCGACAKCLFAAIMLAAFLPPETNRDIFRKDMLDDESLLAILKELTGLVEVKSLDCVGTRDETKAALHLAICRYGNSPLPALLSFAKTDIVADGKTAQALADRILSGYENDAFLPPALKKIIKGAVPA